MTCPYPAHLRERLCASWSNGRIAKGGPGCARVITGNPCTITPEIAAQKVKEEARK